MKFILIQSLVSNVLTCQRVRLSFLTVSMVQKLIFAMNKVIFANRLFLGTKPLMLLKVYRYRTGPQEPLACSNLLVTLQVNHVLQNRQHLYYSNNKYACKNLHKKQYTHRKTKIRENYRLLTKIRKLLQTIHLNCAHFASILEVNAKSNTSNHSQFQLQKKISNLTLHIDPHLDLKGRVISMVNTVIQLQILCVHYKILFRRYLKNQNIPYNAVLNLIKYFNMR